MSRARSFFKVVSWRHFWAYALSVLGNLGEIRRGTYVTLQVTRSVVKVMFVGTIQTPKYSFLLVCLFLPSLGSVPSVDSELYVLNILPFFVSVFSLET